MTQRAEGITLRLSAPFRTIIDDQHPLLRALLLRIARILEQLSGTSLYTRASKTMDTDIDTTRLAARAYPLKQADIFSKIEKFAAFPDEPFMHVFYGWSGTTAFATAGEYEFESKAFTRTLGEAVERYAFEHPYVTSLKRASIETMRHASIDLSSIAGFSSEQRAQNAYLQFDASAMLKWVSFKSQTKRGSIWAPRQAIQHQPDEPLIMHAITTGFAAHYKSEIRAKLAGALECIERDAFMISYLNKHTPKKLSLDSLQHHALKKAVQESQLYKLDVHLLVIPTDFPVHVAAAILIDQTGNSPLVTVGLRATHDIERSAYEALIEAQTARYTYRLHLKSQESSAQATVDPNNQVANRTAVWDSPARLKDLSFFIEGESRDSSEFPVLRKDVPSFYQSIVLYARKEQYDILTCDITPPVIKEHGWGVVCTYMPQLQPLYMKDSEPFLGGVRLASVPKKLGFEARTIEDPGSLPFA